MKTQEKTNQEPLLVNQQPVLTKMTDQLLKDKQEIDELVVQLTQGKAEARTKFEDIKKQMKKSVNDFKETLDSKIKENQVWAIAVKGKLDALESELNKGKAETKEMVTSQRKNILKGIEDVKLELKKNPEALKLANYYTSAAETAKLKMDIIVKKFEDRNPEVTKEFLDEMKNAKKQIDTIIKNVNEKKDAANLKIENFTNEIHLVYDHFKKAIHAL